MSCFQLVGYPDWWRDRPLHEAKGAARVKGQQQGHGANSGCGRGMGVRANATQVAVGRAPEPATEMDKGGLAGLSIE